MINQKERRQSERMPVKVVANCYWYRSGNHQRQDSLSYTKDISFQGAGLVVKQEYRPGTKVLIYLELPSSVVPLMAHSEIVWIKNRSDYSLRRRDRFMAGIKFLKLDDFDKNRLKAFLCTKNPGETCRTSKGR